MALPAASIRYSVVVPVYNVEPYVLACLRSIAAQSWTEFECIVVDDGSTDDSGLLAAAFCAQDPRFRLIQQANRGLSHARNTGIAAASGDDIILIDSDDVVDPRLLEFVARTQAESQADMVIFGYRQFEHDAQIDCGAPYAWRWLAPSKVPRLPNFACIRVASRHHYATHPFPDGLIYEDTVVAPLLAKACPRVAWIDVPLYWYRKREGSLSRSAPEVQFRMLDSLRELEQRVQRLGMPRKVYETTALEMLLVCYLACLKSQSARQRRGLLGRTREFYRPIALPDGISSLASKRSKLLFLTLFVPLMGDAIVLSSPLLMSLNRMRKRLAQRRTALGSAG